MEPPTEDFYQGLTHGARWAVAGLPVSVSGPALTIVAVLTILPVSLGMIWQSDQAFVWLAAAPPLYIGVWTAERVDAAIFRLMAAWVRRLVVVGWKDWGAMTRDPFGT